MIVVGVDPDSKAHGIAIYENEKLTELQCMTIFDIYDLICDLRSKYDNDEILFSIEDVKANNAVFMKQKPYYSGKDLAEVKARSRKLGMVQQSQTELERMLSHIGIKFINHKISKAWKKEKALFEKINGWTGRSNEDTRSAAYFGWLGIKKINLL